MEYVVLECAQSDCRLRFPIKAGIELPSCCPRCGGRIMAVYHYPEDTIKKESRSFHTSGKLFLILDNIRSVYNVGSILRTAEGFGVNHIYLCGITPTPDNPKIEKTGLGAEWSIPWTYSPNNILITQRLKREGCCLLGLEVSSNCEPIFNFRGNLPENIVLIIGNEIAGLDPEIRALCDRLFYLPMLGYKRSFNVTIALGIACFYFRYKNYFL